VEPFTLGHRPALDGLRGLAISLVVLFHIPMLPFGGGFLGVDLFFVLSGFLITSLLLVEWQETSGISLKAFYARRALRLLPALVAVLVAAVLASALIDAPREASAMRRSALITVFYSANWFKAFGAYPRDELSHTWSLSVEEQFYLLWPLVLTLLLKNRSRILTGVLLVAGIVASAGVRAWLWSSTGSWERVYFGSDTHADGLLCGALAAWILSWRGVPKGPLLNALAVPVLLLTGLVVCVSWPADAFILQGGLLALNVGFALLVLTLVSSPWGWFRRLLEVAPLVWLGKISYGVYLWHVVVFWLLGRAGWGLGYWHWPAAAAGTIGVSALSFYALERPILRLKRRFERVRAS
jgi:peptidoglycan/LPS O-acetylase OafA/YrhL